MAKTRNLERALQQEALMHQSKNPPSNDFSTPRMTRSQNLRRGNRLSDVNPEEVLGHHLESPPPDENSSDQARQDKTRGYTFCPDIWGLPSGVKLPVHLNKFGQPIGQNRSKLATFLGSLAKIGKYCPIDIFDWRKVPTSNKKELLDIVQSKFSGILGMDEWILQSIGGKWRNWKKDLKEKYFNPNMPVEYLVNLVKGKDERVNEEQWRGLLRHWLSEEGKKVSMRGKEARKKKKLNHITGRKSFAQMRENEETLIGREPTRAEIFSKCFQVEKEGEARQVMQTMQGLINGLEDPSQDVVSRNDIFSIANGPEKPGRLRTYGHGVTPTDLLEEAPTRRTCFLLMQKMQERLNILENSATQQNRSEVSSPVDSILQSRSFSDQRISTSVTNNPQPPPAINNPTRPPSLTNNPRPLRVNCSVALLSIVDRNEIVAKGYLKNMESSTQVGGQVLGKSYCEVHVNVAVKRDEDLVRPYDWLETMGDALGRSISWPISLVVRDED